MNTEDIKYSIINSTYVLRAPYKNFDASKLFIEEPLNQDSHCTKLESCSFHKFSFMYKHTDGKIKQFKLEAPGNFYNDEEFISLYGVQEFFNEYYDKKTAQDLIDAKIRSQFQISCILSHKFESHTSFKKILYVMYVMASQFMEKHRTNGTEIFDSYYKTPYPSDGFDLVDHLKYPCYPYTKLMINNKTGRRYRKYLKPEDHEGPSCIIFDVNLDTDTWKGLNFKRQDISDFIELEMDTTIKRKHITDFKDLSCQMKLIPLVNFSLAVSSSIRGGEIIINLESAIINRNVPDKINEQGETIQEITQRITVFENSHV